MHGLAVRMKVCLAGKRVRMQAGIRHENYKSTAIRPDPIHCVLWGFLNDTQGTTLTQYKKKGDTEPKRAMTVGSGWSVQRGARPGDGFVLTAPGRVTKLKASTEQEEQQVR